MNKTYKPLLVVLLLASAVLIGSHYLQQGDKELIPWRTDLTAASAEAKRLHKPVFVDFTASWCGPCRQMARTTWSDPKVAAALGEMVSVRIDIDQNQDLASKYGVRAIPTYMILDDKGETARIGQGYLPPGAFLSWLNSKPEAATSRPD